MKKKVESKTSLAYSKFVLNLYKLLNFFYQETIANFNANQLFQQEEEEKNMFLNSEALKKSMATQVDYVELIVSRNTEDYRREQEKVAPLIDMTPKISIQEPTIIEDVIADTRQISPRRQYTVHSQSHSIENSSKLFFLMLQNQKICNQLCVMFH